MKEKVKEIERQWREGMPIIESDWELVFSYIFQLENQMEKLREKMKEKVEEKYNK